MIVEFELNSLQIYNLLFFFPYNNTFILQKND